ncbi:hypothetical protein ACHAWC_005537 [Mediolabrus comicus]
MEAPPLQDILHNNDAAVAAVDDPTINPFAADLPPPSTLHQLITSKDWDGAIQRCQSYPNEVSSQHRDYRGYTALHTLLAYNRTTVGMELVPLVKAILRAAEQIDFGAEFSLSLGTESNDNNNHTTTTNRKTGGAHRLLLDQNNRAQWSPIHLICVQGGFSRGKVDLLMALLQVGEISIEQQQQQQQRQQLLSLVDRQKRTILHHLLETRMPSEDSFRTVHYIIHKQFSLLYNKDDRGKTPLEYVFDRYRQDGPSMVQVTGRMLARGNGIPVAVRGDGGDGGGRRVGAEQQLLNGIPAAVRADPNGVVARRLLPVGGPARVARRVPAEQQGGPLGVPRRLPGFNLLEDFGDNNEETMSEATKKTLLMMKVLIGYLDRGEEMTKTTMIEANNGAVNNDDIIPRNIYHSVCRLPRNACPIQIFQGLFQGYTDLEKEVDENGNTNLHIFLANTSYSTRTCKISSGELNCQREACRSLVESNRDALYMQNNKGHLPLRVAMDTGRKEVLSDLIMTNYKAVLMDKRLDSPKLMAHVLGLIADVIKDRNSHPLETIFELVRAKPDVVEFGGAGMERLEQIEGEGKMEEHHEEKKGQEEEEEQAKGGWKQKLNPFRMFGKERRNE